jgi:hypothetical protein
MLVRRRVAARLRIEDFGWRRLAKDGSRESRAYLAHYEGGQVRAAYAQVTYAPGVRERVMEAAVSPIPQASLEERRKNPRAQEHLERQVAQRLEADIRHLRDRRDRASAAALASLPVMLERPGVLERPV